VFSGAFGRMPAGRVIFRRRAIGRRRTTPDWF